jgi:cyclic beta-1,2-glucan synthetase
LEGSYARAGLATDVMVYDDVPASYAGHAARKHRWIRGDWQLLPWLRTTVPGPSGPERNRLSMISRWKLLDNLRRSLVEVTQLLFLVAGWTILPGSVVRWTALGLGALMAPWATVLLRAVLQPPRDKSWRAYYAAVGQDAVVSAQQAFVALVFLPHQAWMSLDAIARTLYRLFVSRRQLLEWQSASFVERTARAQRMSDSSLRASAMAVAVGVTAWSVVAVRAQWALGQPLSELAPAALAVWSIALLWMSAPHWAAVWSTQVAPTRQPLSATERDTALRYAAAHWQYFERFVTAETHGLAPDNFQFEPEPVVAMRTSPTNIGLQLLATVSACDLGFISAIDMTGHLARAVRTLELLPRYRGHFFNWYNLHDLSVLTPHYVSTVDSGNLAGHLIALRQACLQMAVTEPDVRDRLLAIAEQAYALVIAMDFTFLYHEQRKLFTIGYHPDSLTADDSCYDLLASEARLASFVAIAKDDVPVEHWFRLSRALNRTAAATALVSWSGSMFEYLMPLLVMRSWPFTMLEQTYVGALSRQRAYARHRDVPWGISESAYNVRDQHLTYQYHAFGVPDLALKRGLAHDLVIAPYASALAAMVHPSQALANLQLLETKGALGAYGFCDALDYTRPAAGERFALVRTYMAHHVGMSLVALTNVLLDNRWQERFHADSLVRSAELLLHERVPRRLVMHSAQRLRLDEEAPDRSGAQSVMREINTRQASAPRIALLGAVPYTVMLNHNGSGFSRYDGVDVTRWRADSTRDDAGQFCYLKDVGNGRVWSAAHQPLCTVADSSSAQLGSDRVTLHRVDGDIETCTTITVVPGDSAEVRCVTLTNRGRSARDIELTSYAEVVMAPAASDQAHRAFSNLFVETEWHAWCSAITAHRRPRAAHEPELWCVHVVDAGRDRVGAVSCETDRGRFLGRGRSVRDPVAMETDGALSGTTGAVLDPIVALRTRVRVAPGQSVRVAFTTLVATSRALAFELADRYHDAHAAQRALDFAWSVTESERLELGITSANAAVYQDVATQLLYRGGSLAPPPDELRRNRSGQPRLWVHRISGDMPIVLATIDSVDGLSTLRELFVAHSYWRRRGLAVDLVVLNGHPHDYLQELRDAIATVMVAANDATILDQPGGVFVRRLDAFDADDLLMLVATARVKLVCDGRSLSRVLASADSLMAEAAASRLVTAERRGTVRRAPSGVPWFGATGVRLNPLASIASVLRPLVAPLLPRVLRPRALPPAVPFPREALAFDNGLGGLDARGAYCITVSDDWLPPAPWVNVIANPFGGFMVSERGAGCTWAENAHFYRLTPWHNDPVSDPCSDVLFLHDADSGEVWSATPAPVRTTAPYRVRHRPGQSTFEHHHDGIETMLTVGMPEDAAVKLSMLRITNTSSRPRRLLVTAYVEWVLGARREDTQYQVHTRYLPGEGALMAQNHFDPNFTTWTAFLATSEPVSSYSADRSSFIGRDGCLAAPAALFREHLDGNTGVGLDPCAALQMRLVLAPGESREITVLLGAARSEAEARTTLMRLRPTARVAAAQSCSAWDTRLGVITVRTPDPAFDAMLNSWTLYQALGCRMWARTGLYQSSGAYGFRDQLQDVMAFVYAEPAIARTHILRCAARQFVEGDVQHWWHPHSGRGVRTRFSDDLAWLPYVDDQYVRVTGDAAILDAYVPFLTMRALEPHEHELYDLPTITDEHGSVYEHCRRALRRACTSGPHGLPLIGSGDWNDGMSRVGVEGVGESVWLAWFLIATLRAFAMRADAREDRTEAAFMRQRADDYVTAVEAHGWDGAWYRRAFYDDGTPLGSAASDECRIDSIAQSWSVISGAGRADRQALAMEALHTHLVHRDARLIKLLAPPFDRGTHDPGYIKGYLPGVRENGAQYTHAALWAAMATAMRGEGDRAFDLFQMLNPFTHSATAAEMERYRVEPYVVAADVYTAPAQFGRGGWTWYTGSASWMYRVGLEQILGFTKVGNTLRMNPCVPAAWPAYTITYRFGSSCYEITVLAPAAVPLRGWRVTVNGALMASGVIPLVDDGALHRVTVDAPLRWS